MTWSRQEPSSPWNPKIAPLSDAAYRLYFTARDYASFWHTEGFVAAEVVPRLCGAPRGKKLERTIAELVRVRAGEQNPLWVKDEDAGGYRIHDYLDYNPTNAEVQERQGERQAGKVAGGRARATGAVRVGGRFVKAAVAGSAGVSTDQQPPAAAPAEPPAATSTVAVSDSSNVVDNVDVNAGSPAEDHQQAPAGHDQQASEAMVTRMLDVLGDGHSVGLYRRIALAAPEGLIFEALGEVKYLAQMGRIRKSRGAVFTDLMKREAHARGLDLGFGVVAHAGVPPRKEPRPLVAVATPQLDDAEAAELAAALDDLRRRVVPAAVNQ